MPEGTRPQSPPGLSVPAPTKGRVRSDHPIGPPEFPKARSASETQSARLKAPWGNWDTRASRGGYCAPVTPDAAGDAQRLRAQPTPGNLMVVFARGQKSTGLNTPKRPSPFGVRLPSQRLPRPARVSTAAPRYLGTGRRSLPQLKCQLATQHWVRDLARMEMLRWKGSPSDRHSRGRTGKS